MQNNDVFWNMYMHINIIYNFNLDLLPLFTQSLDFTQWVRQVESCVLYLFSVFNKTLHWLKNYYFYTFSCIELSLAVSNRNRFLSLCASSWKRLRCLEELISNYLNSNNENFFDGANDIWHTSVTYLIIKY